MRKHVLIPTDFSLNALNAIKYAFELFKNEDCTFHIYHSYYIVASSKGNPMFPVPDEMEYRNVRQNIVAEMEYLEKNVTAISENEKHELLFDFEYGFLTDGIREKVEKENIDLVVMGTRGKTDDKKLSYGRNTIEVMEKMRNCPVMAVPSNVKYKEFNEIIFPTNFEENYNLDDLEIFKSIAQITTASIGIFHLGEDRDLNQKHQHNKMLLEDHLRPVEVNYHFMSDKNLLESLLQFVNNRNSSMICFVNRKHWFFGNIFSNPLIKGLGVLSTVPILALHDH